MHLKIHIYHIKNKVVLSTENMRIAPKLLPSVCIVYMKLERHSNILEFKTHYMMQVPMKLWFIFTLAPFCLLKNDNNWNTNLKINPPISINELK